jgi:hypothetical protein
MIAEHVSMTGKVAALDRLPRWLFRVGLVLVAWSAANMIYAATSQGEGYIVATPWTYIAVICAVVAFALDVTNHKNGLV